MDTNALTYAERKWHFSAKLVLGAQNPFGGLKTTSNGSLSFAFPVQVSVLEHTKPHTHPLTHSPTVDPHTRPPPSHHPISGDRLIARHVRMQCPPQTKGKTTRDSNTCNPELSWFKPCGLEYEYSLLPVTTAILAFTFLQYRLSGPDAVVPCCSGHLIRPLAFWERITSARVSTLPPHPHRRHNIYDPCSHGNT